MDLNKIREEMQKAQLEYATNPSSANLAKMMKLQQDMVAASMQGMPQSAADMFGADSLFVADTMAQMQNATALGQSLSGMTGFEDDDKARADFVKKNPPAPDNAKYLPIGAFLLLTNGVPVGTFKLMEDKEEWADAISDGWEIENAKEGIEFLESLTKGHHTKHFDEDFRLFMAGKRHGLDKGSVKAHKEMTKIIKEEIPALLPYVQSCNTILAWDLERAAYLARIFTHIGWINEKKCFEWLKKIAAEIKKTFKSWEEYAVSIMTGRALHFESADSVLGAAYELFVEDNSFLQAHKFSAI